MGNIVTYTKTELRTFDEMSLNTVDSVVYSWLSYLRWPKALFADIGRAEIVKALTSSGANSDTQLAVALRPPYKLAELFKAEYFPEMTANLGNKDGGFDLLAAAVASPRFRETYVIDYDFQTDIEEEKQFAGMTFRMPNGLHYVAFRGTDSTFIGWKEDLNMAFQYPVPAQESAAEYLSRTARKFDGKFYIGGHSKGGNLAIYAAANCPELYDRIINVYSHDGPGFLQEVIESPNFRRISSKVEKTVPQSSVVGMLLQQHAAYRVIKSNNKSLWQHDAFSWEVEGSDFVELEELNKSSVLFEKNVNEWIASFDKEKREAFIDALFQLTENLDITTLNEFNDDLKTNIPTVIQTLGGFDKETKELIFMVLKRLAYYSIVGSLPNRDDK